MGLGTFKLLVLLLLLQGDLNCSLQKKKGLGVTLGIRGRQCYREVSAQLPPSCSPALSCCSSSLPQFPLCQNCGSNAAGLYGLLSGRIACYSSGSISEHRFKHYQFILFPLLQNPIPGWGSPCRHSCSFEREAGFVNTVPNSNLRVFLLYVMNYISVLALNSISHMSPQ